MKFKNLVPGKILKRYKRFLTDIELENGEIITAHLANTGSMKTCWQPSWPVLLSYHDNPNRKLKYSVEMINNGETWIGVNTQLTNKIVKNSIENSLIPELADYANIQSEKKVEKSRIDLYLTNHKIKKNCYVEIKNVTLLGNNKTALFPDAPTERGQKHINDLMKLKEIGHRVCMFYLVQREDIEIFTPSKEIDPKYSELLGNAYKRGLEILVYKCKLTPQSIEIDQRINCKL